MAQKILVSLANSILNNANKPKAPVRESLLRNAFRILFDLAGFALLTIAGFTVSSLAGYIVAGLSCFLLGRHFTAKAATNTDPMMRT